MIKDDFEPLKEAKAIVSLTYNKSHFIKFSEYISKNYSMECSILLGIIINLENLYLDKYKSFLIKTNGYFPVKSNYIEDKIGMSYHKQNKAFEILKENNIITTKKWAGNIILYSLNHLVLSKILIQGSIEEIKNREENNVDESYNKNIEDMEKILSEINEMSQSQMPCY